MMEMGMIVMPDVLSVRNIIIELLAVSFALLMLCNSCMALRPMGVAALSRPSILAEIFIKMAPKAG